MATKKKDEWAEDESWFGRCTSCSRTGARVAPVVNPEPDKDGVNQPGHWCWGCWSSAQPKAKKGKGFG